MTQDPAAPAPTTTWRNWARNQHATAAAVAAPTCTDDVVQLVKQAAAAGRRVKAVGSGHSFSAAAHTDDQRVELSRMAGLVSVDRSARLVTVQAGMPLHVLNRVLAGNGLALANLGDIEAQTVAGAIATGTHGTGSAYGTLASLVEAVTVVTGTGDVLTCSAGSQFFPALQVSLGALGILVEVTLRCVDAFVLRADERPAALADVLAALPEHLAGNDHMEFYWFPYTDRVQLIRNNRVPADVAPLPGWRSRLNDQVLSNTVFGAACRLGRVLPAAVPAINRLSARALGSRTYTGRSDRVFCTVRQVRFTEMEYAVPRAALPEVMAALPRVVDDLPYRVQFPVEVRFTGPDDIWLSHGYGRESAYVAVHQYTGAPYEAYFRAFEAVCAPLGGRPHWGKLHYRDAASLREVYPRFDDFLAVRDRLDPERVFANGYTRQVLGD